MMMAKHYVAIVNAKNHAKWTRKRKIVGLKRAIEDMKMLDAVFERFTERLIPFLMEDNPAFDADHFRFHMHKGA